MPREIISEEEIPLPIVKKIVSKRGKEGELSFQQNITLEHATTFSKMTPATAAKLMEKLTESFGLTRVQAAQIVNIAPRTMEELRTILDRESTSITDEQLSEIIALVSKSVS
ncbi:MAG: RNA polymerase Rpb4 family protein [Candidatus Thorarchaeota archaeon]